MAFLYRFAIVDKVSTDIECSRGSFTVAELLVLFWHLISTYFMFFTAKKLSNNGLRSPVSEQMTTTTTMILIVMNTYKPFCFRTSGSESS